MNIKRFFAVFKARNIEFVRDKSSLGWNFFFPVLLLVGFSFIFSGDGRPAYKVGWVEEVKKIQDETLQNPFEDTRFIDFISYKDIEIAKGKLSRHTIDLVISEQSKRYWVNDESAKSYLVEKIFSDKLAGYKRLQTTGKKFVTLTGYYQAY